MDYRNTFPRLRVAIAAAFGMTSLNCFFCLTQDAPARLRIRGVSRSALGDYNCFSSLMRSMDRSLGR